MNWQGRQGSQQGTIALQQNGNNLTGIMQGQRGPAPISGTIKVNKVSFDVELKGERHSMTLAFTGTVEADKMSGIFQPQGGGRGGRGEQGDHTWSATRRSRNSGGSDQPGNAN